MHVKVKKNMYTEHKIIEILENLKDYISKNDNVTQETVAKQIGVHQTTVGRWFSGRIKHIKTIYLIKIQGILDMNYNSIKDKYIVELENKVKRIESEIEILKKELRSKGIVRIVT